MSGYDVCFAGDDSPVGKFHQSNLLTLSPSKCLLVFLGCLLFIVGVSVYDTYLVMVYRDQMLVTEKNPVCVALIKQDPTELSYFLAGKFLGNVGVLTVLLALRICRYRRYLTVAFGVGAFQLALLGFLQLSDAKTGFLYFDNLSSSDPHIFAKAIKNLACHIVGFCGLAVSAQVMLLWYKSKQKLTARRFG